ncbi:MAG: virginiamycin B lyase family protein, partial [Solirubrobacterales bacterium]
GPDGNMWFTELSGNRIGKITPAGVITEYSAGITAGAAPYGIAAGPDGNMWFTERNGNRIGKITPAGVVTEYSAGITAGANPFGIAAGPDGNMWFTQFTGNRIGKVIVGLDLSVTRAGSGSGTVTSSVGGIDCGSSCSAQFDGGTSVTLTATPSPGSTFGGWSGACSGSAESCTVLMNQARAVTAGFTATPTPTPTPAATVKVASVKQKVSRKGAWITSRVTVSGAGKISQRATTGSKRLTTRCRVLKTTTSASTHTLKCNLGSRGRRALKKGALKLTLRTTFTPTSGNPVTDTRKLTIKRRR